MRKLTFFALGLVALAAAASPADADRWHRHGSGHHVEGSGEFETRSYDLKDFDAIRIDGVFEVEVEIGDAFAVEIEAEDNLFDYIVADVRRGELRLDMEDDVEIETDEKILVMITMPALVEIEGNGVYEFRAAGLDNQELTIHASGVGQIELEGRTGKLRVECDGVGNTDLRDLVAQDADVRVDGIGDVYVFVERDLRARVSGLGSIHYAGDPASVDDRADGFGSIERAD
jgi:hypothetical protein